MPGGALANTGLFARWYVAGRNRGADDARETLLLCDKAREILADTNSRFIQFREVLLAMDGKADDEGWAAENTLLCTIRARGDRILQTPGHNNILTMAGVRNRLLLPEAGIAPENF